MIHSTLPAYISTQSAIYHHNKTIRHKTVSKIPQNRWCQQVIVIMIWYKSSIQERSSPLGAKMGRGSPVCQQLREKIIEMFKNNVPQRKMGTDLDISPSTVHNIIKRFKESGGISVGFFSGKNNVPQRKMGTDLDISPSTVHNIIKRFKESGGISVGFLLSKQISFLQVLHSIFTLCYPVRPGS